MRIIFQNPEYLWILAILPLLAIFHLFLFNVKKTLALKFSNFEALEKVSGKSSISYYKGFFSRRDLYFIFLKTIIYSFFILAISGAVLEYQGKASNFDFIIAIDSSSSMLANDFHPNRLEAAKEAALLFVDSVAKQTNIGIVSFSGEVFTNLIPTKNHFKVKNAIKSIEISAMGGTNIGDALITAANLLEGENPKKVILLTDGQANVGTEPMDSIGYLHSKNITAYPIGVATKEGGEVEFGFTSKLDEETLQMIAEKTNGKYYRAENKEVLEGAFREMASSTIKKVSLNISMALLIIGFVLLVFEWFLVSTKYRIVP